MRPAEIWRRRLPISIVAFIGISLLIIHTHIGPRAGSHHHRVHHNNTLFLTTTTTTPTPYLLMLKPANSNFTIEKYDPLKVHSQIMKMKLSKIGHRQKDVSLVNRQHLFSEDLHLFYNDFFKLHANSSNSSEVVISNLQLAEAAGAAVLIVKCSRLPPLQHPNHSIFKLLFLLAPSYKLKITIAIKEYIKRNVMSIRRDIRIFLSTYGKEKALYEAAGFDGVKRPVIYIMDSFSISANEWTEILGPNRQSTIRNTPIDSIVLGQLLHEEHGSHVRRSLFDGFFTGCYPNGESFGSTWKNWQSLSIWAKTHSLLWSASIVDGDGGAQALGAGLRTTLRSRPRPTFVSLCKLLLTTDYTNEVQTWLNSWNQKIS